MAEEPSPDPAPDPLSSLSPDEKRKQALETFKHAAQEIRFYISQKWQVTNYVLVTYGALVAAPALVVDCKDAANAFLCTAANAVGALLVLGTAVLGYVILRSLYKSQKKELKRMKEALGDLPRVKQIHEKFTFKGEVVKDPRPGRSHCVLVAALTTGAFLAISINMSRLPWAGIAACISQSASG